MLGSWLLGSRGARRAAGLPFSGPLAGYGVGWALVGVLPLRVVRRQSHHANGFYARQPRHPPSIHLDALNVETSQFEAESRLPNYQTADIHQQISAGTEGAPMERTVCAQHGRELMG